MRYIIGIIASVPKCKWKPSYSVDSLSDTRIATLHSSHPASDHGSLLLPCSILPAFIEHKLWCTEGIQDKFVKHDVRLFLVPASPGDPWLESQEYRAAHRRSRRQLATDMCWVKQIFLFKRQTAEKQLFDPCCLRDRRERKVFFVIALQRSVCSSVYTVTTKTQALIIHCSQPQLRYEHYAQL